MCLNRNKTVTIRYSVQQNRLDNVYHPCWVNSAYIYKIYAQLRCITKRGQWHIRRGSMSIQVGYRLTDWSRLLNKKLDWLDAIWLSRYWRYAIVNHMCTNSGFNPIFNYIFTPTLNPNCCPISVSLQNGRHHSPNRAPRHWHLQSPWPRRGEGHAGRRYKVWLSIRQQQGNRFHRGGCRSCIWIGKTCITLQLLTSICITSDHLYSQRSSFRLPHRRRRHARSSQMFVIRLKANNTSSLTISIEPWLVWNAYRNPRPRASAGRLWPPTRI